jgi:hypothetical protein
MNSIFDRLTVVVTRRHPAQEGASPISLLCFLDARTQHLNAASALISTLNGVEGVLVRQLVLASLGDLEIRVYLYHLGR